MSAVLALPDPDLRALAAGASVVAFVARAGVDIGDEVVLEPSGPRPATALVSAYAAWADAGPPSGRWTGVVEAVHPSAMLDTASFTGRSEDPAGAGEAPPYILARPPGGDLVVLRVYGPEGPALSDAAFAARVLALEGTLR